MKKNIIIAAAAFIAVLAVSCAAQNINNDTKETETSVTTEAVTEAVTEEETEEETEMETEAETESSTEAASEEPAFIEIDYSNLVETEIQSELDELMMETGVPEDRRQVFFRHVDQINAVMEPDQLTVGYETGNGLKPKYDSYEVQDMWTSHYPDFIGYNCRITAFTLFGDLIRVPVNTEIRENPLMFDLDALNFDPSAFPGSEASFAAFYSEVPTEKTKDIMVHVENLKKDWKERGIRFVENPDRSLISVVFHDMIDKNENNLFIGHTGVLFTKAPDELYFVEKVAFQEPYQCIRFTDRSELVDYLMGKYDVEYGQPNAAPFIMENGELIEGFTERLEKK